MAQKDRPDFARLGSLGRAVGSRKDRSNSMRAEWSQLTEGFKL